MARRASRGDRASLVTGGVENLRPFEPGNTAAMRHGAASERQIRPIAANHRRRVLRQLRLRAGDLDSIARGYLDLYCRTSAKIELLDRYFDEKGLLDGRGNPRGATKFYTSLVNSSRLALKALEGHLRERQRDYASPLAILEGEGRRVRLEAEARLGNGAG